MGFRVLDVGTGVLLWVMDRVRVRVGLSVRLSVSVKGFRCRVLV